MTFKEQYDQLIEYRKNNPVPTGVYSEKHHIKPKSLFPELEKDKNNIVSLTASEHFKAHYYLWKHYQLELRDKKMARSMCYAVCRMKAQLNHCDDLDLLARLYAEAREYKAKVGQSKDQREKMSRSIKATRSRPEVRERYRQSKMGEKNPMFGKKQSEETKRKRSEALKGHVGYWRGKKWSKERLEARHQMRWWNNGQKNTLAKECPEGFVAGRVKKDLTTK